MTERAEQMRTRRQVSAAPGSRHDRLIKFLSLVLPMAVGVLVAFLGLAPLLKGTEVSFLLDKDQVDIARERMRITNAQYRGEDSTGRAFSLKAGSAVQRSSKQPIVELNDLSARLLLDNGPGVLIADDGTYNMETENVAVVGPVRFTSSNGYRLVTRDVDVDIPARKLESRGAVTGRIPAGTFSADKLKANLAERTVTLEGRARLRMTQTPR